jgi:hypothetical protein
MSRQSTVNSRQTLAQGCESLRFAPAALRLQSESYALSTVDCRLSTFPMRRG